MKQPHQAAERHDGSELVQHEEGGDVRDRTVDEARGVGAEALGELGGNGLGGGGGRRGRDWGWRARWRGAREEARAAGFKGGEVGAGLAEEAEA